MQICDTFFSLLPVFFVGLKRFSFRGGSVAFPKDTDRIKSI